MSAVPHLQLVPPPTRREPVRATRIGRPVPLELRAALAVLRARAQLDLYALGDHVAELIDATCDCDSEE